MLRDEKDIMLKSLRFKDWFCLCPEVIQEKVYSVGTLRQSLSPSDGATCT